MLDEPTAGLDPLMQQEVYRLLREAQAGGATVFFSSHIISKVEAIAERVAIIREGRIAEVVEPHRLIDMAVRRVHVRFREIVPAESIKSIPGVVLVDQHDGRATFQVEGEMDALVKALAAFPVADLETERPSLEEIFLTLYSN